MIKTLSNLLQQDREKYRVPRRVHGRDSPSGVSGRTGIFLVGDKYSKMYRFTDINYLVASRADKESMFLQYSELLNSLDAGATSKITINNRRLNRVNFEKNILMPLRGDTRDIYRREYNRMRWIRQWRATASFRRSTSPSRCSKGHRRGSFLLCPHRRRSLLLLCRPRRQVYRAGCHRAPARPARFLPCRRRGGLSL